MGKRWLATGLVIAVAALMVGAVACSSKKSTTNPTSTISSGETPKQTASNTPASAQSAVAVTLVEYKVVPVPTSAPAGSVTFNAKNIGGTDHTLLVISTKLAQDALPTKADGSVDEKSPDITILGTTAAIPAQQGTPLTVKLEPGTYVLICNVVQTSNGKTTSHYTQGMHVAFTITP